VFDPAADKRQWYTQLMFAQHAANLAPVWGPQSGHGASGHHVSSTAAAAPITFDPLKPPRPADETRIYSCSAPTGSGKSATLNNILKPGDGDLPAAPCFIVEGGQTASACFGDFAARLGPSPCIG
jgi:hypothetical protein